MALSGSKSDAPDVRHCRSRADRGSAAVALREEGFGGDLVLIGAAPEVPYERPPLSKEYLRGEATLEDLLVRPPNFYPDQGIQTRLGMRATKVDLEGKVVELEDGSRLPYDKFLLATGGRNRRPPIKGLDLDGVYDLRTVSDADSIRSEVAPGRKAVIVGMGFIGSEVTASLRMLGVEVSVIARSKLPLARVLGEEIARVMESIHRDQGVEMVFEDAVEAFEGIGRVGRVRTQGGRVIACDFVVVGLGIEPITEVVADSAVRIENGIVVDEYCQASVAGVYAAGDVANHYHPVFDRRIRVEHWQHAIKHGQAAARSMLGSQKPYDEVYWFWSDQYNYTLQYAGFATDWDELIVRGSLQQRKFVAFYLKGGRILATASMNRGKDVRQSVGLIKAGIQVDLARLRDEAVQVSDLAES